MHVLDIPPHDLGQNVHRVKHTFMVYQCCMHDFRLYLVNYPKKSHDECLHPHFTDQNMRHRTASSSVKGRPVGRRERRDLSLQTPAHLGQVEEGGAHPSCSPPRLPLLPSLVGNTTNTHRKGQQTQAAEARAARADPLPHRGFLCILKLLPGKGASQSVTGGNRDARRPSGLELSGGHAG